MKRAFLLLTMLCLATLARADDQTLAVQQALKDQGFYYSTVDGQPGPETDAAIRRYQIRQGLDVTGKLNAQTLASLNLGGSAPKTSDTAAPAPDSTDAPPADSQPSDEQPAPTPAPSVVQSDHDFLQSHPTPAAPDAPAPDDAAPQPAPPSEPAEPEEPVAPPVRVEPAQPVPPAPELERQPSPEYSGFFRKTPYEIAPAVVQETTVRQAQARLGRQGFYRGYADGRLSEGFSRAIASYQGVLDLRVTGRLDMETLDSLNLLPARHEIPRPPVPEDVPGGVYRGIWVH